MGYKIRELTPESMKCGIIYGCPSIYELVSSDCAIGGCPSVYGDKDDEDIYLIRGDVIDPKEVGLEENFGEKEALVKIPKRLLENIV
jgi:hypothetical protein